MGRRLGVDAESDGHIVVRLDVVAAGNDGRDLFAPFDGLRKRNA